MRHIISSRYTRDQNGMIRVSMTCDDGEIISYRMTMETLMTGVTAAVNLVNADMAGALDEVRGQSVLRLH